MSLRTIALTDELHAYMLEASLRETDVMRRLRAETATLERARMQISPEQGQFMRLLVELTGARRAIEVGTFTGYSALCIASAMPPDGRLICCDVSREWTAIALRYWADAGVAARIDLRLGEAVHTLDQLLAAGHAGMHDLFFIDADKESYDAYYEHALALLRPGGIVLVDNAFKGGRVVRPVPDDRESQAIDALNRKIQADQRVACSLVPIGDGLMLARKR